MHERDLGIGENIRERFFINIKHECDIQTIPTFLGGGMELCTSEVAPQRLIKVNVSDTIWKVRGPDLAVGTKVKIKSVDGTSLVVEPMTS